MKVRAYEPKDDSALNRLKLKAFESGMERMRLDFWDWQFMQNPAGKGNGCVAVEGDEIMGFLGFVPKRIKMGERIVTSAQLLDYMVDPTIKGGYLSASLARRVNGIAKEAGFAFSFCLPNKNSYRIAVSKRIGMSHIFSPSVWIKPLRNFPVPSLALRLGVPSAVTRLATGCVALLSTYLSPSRVPDDVVVRAITAIDDRLDKLWQVASQQHPVLFVRDAEYLEWRYMRHPVYQYRLLLAEVKGQPAGFVVLLERHFEGLRLGQIVDWLVSPVFPQAGAWLFRVAEDWAREAGLDALTVAALPATRGAHDMRRMGYFPVPKRFEPVTTNFVALCFENSLESCFQNPTQWFWTWGDSDVV